MFKSKLCIIMKVQEMLSNSYIYTKTVPTVHNLYQIQIEELETCEVCFFADEKKVQIIQIIYN